MDFYKDIYENMFSPHQQGTLAYHGHTSMSGNPYPPGKERTEWNAGWVAGLIDHMNRIFKGGVNDAARS